MEPEPEFDLMAEIDRHIADEDMNAPPAALAVQQPVEDIDMHIANLLMEEDI